MGTEPVDPPEGFNELDAAQPDDDYDTTWVDRPEVGDQIRGMLLAAKPDRGEHNSTVLEMRLTAPYAEEDAETVVAMWSTNGIDDKLEQNDVSRGQEIVIQCDDTFEMDDGRTARNYRVFA